MQDYEIQFNGMSDEDVAEMYMMVTAEMHDRKMTEEAAEVLALAPSLVEDCERLLETGEGFSVGMVEVGIHHPEEHPSYITIRSLDSGHMLRMLLVINYTNPLELVHVVREESRKEMERL